MAAKEKAEPVDIAVDRQGNRMTIEWKDGHSSPFPLDLLRSKCPCASCRQHQQPALAEGQLRVLPSNVSEDSVQVASVKMVGRYALQILWKDGHDTGIYGFEYLRKLCPCDACAGAPQ